MENKKIYSNYDDFRELQIDGKYREETIKKALSCLEPNERYIPLEHTNSYFIPLKEGYVDFNRYILENSGLLKNHENVIRAQENERKKYGSSKINIDDWIYEGNGNRIEVTGGNAFFEKLERDLVNNTVMSNGNYKISTKDYLGPMIQFVNLEKDNLVVIPQDEKESWGYMSGLFKIQSFTVGEFKKPADMNLARLKEWAKRYDNLLSMELFTEITQSKMEQSKIKNISPDLKNLEGIVNFDISINPCQPPSRERIIKILDYIRLQGESFVVGWGGDGGGVGCYHLVIPQKQ